MSEHVRESESGRVETTVLGFPRIGRDRHLAMALEAYWRHEIDETKLANLAQTARWHGLLPAAAAGLDTVPSGDQALYDHVLDTALMLGAVPPRFAHLDPGPERELAMAHGARGTTPLPGCAGASCWGCVLRTWTWWPAGCACAAPTTATGSPMPSRSARSARSWSRPGWWPSWPTCRRQRPSMASPVSCWRARWRADPTGGPRPRLAPGSEAGRGGPPHYPRPAPPRNLDVD